MARGLMPDYKINLLRDIRKQVKSFDKSWLSNDDYVDFELLYPGLEKVVKSMDKPLKQNFQISWEQYMRQLSKKRPATNFNPDNKLGKPREPWTYRQVKRLARISGL